MVKMRRVLETLSWELAVLGFSNPDSPHGATFSPLFLGTSLSLHQAASRPHGSSLRQVLLVGADNFTLLGKPLLG